MNKWNNNKLAAFDFAPAGFTLFRANTPSSAQTNSTGWFKLQCLNSSSPVVINTSVDLLSQTRLSAATFNGIVNGYFTSISLSGNSGDLLAYNMPQ